MPERSLSTRRSWLAQADRCVRFIIAGLLVSILVAEACALWSTIRPATGAVRVRYEDTDAWTFIVSRFIVGGGRTNDPNPGLLFDRLEGEIDSLRATAIDLSLSQRTVQEVTIDRATGLLVINIGLGNTWPDSLERQIQRAGVPFKCLTARGDVFLSTPSTERSWNGAVSAPVWLQAGQRWPRVLLYGPVWSGLALNTAFYGACLWCVSLMPRLIRRHLRAGTGRCLTCGYHLTGLPTSTTCPECGAAPKPIRGFEDSASA